MVVLVLLLLLLLLVSLVPVVLLLLLMGLPLDVRCLEAVDSPLFEKKKYVSHCLQGGGGVPTHSTTLILAAEPVRSP